MNSICTVDQIGNQSDVNKPQQSTTTERQEVENPHSNLVEIKPMTAQWAEEKPQQVRDQNILL